MKHLGDFTSGDDLKISVFDFAGQSVFASLHQLFLSSSSIYIIVFSLYDLIKGSEDEALLAATRWFWENKKPMMSVCHGVEIPARAGIVKGLRMATVPKCKFDLEVCGGVFVNAPVVIDRNMVSGRTFHDNGAFVGPWIKMLEAEVAKK